MDDEQRVETMIAEGTGIMREAIEQYRPVAIVAAYSSGDDSSVSTHFAMSNFSDCFVFNASTMVALEPSRCHLREVCQRFNWQLEIGEANAEGQPATMLVPRDDGSGKKKKVAFDPAILPAGKWSDGASAYEELVLNHGFPGPGMHHRAYQRLKERPFRRMLKRFGASPVDGKPKVLIVSGIRHDESSRRAGYQRACAAGYFGDIWVNPFYWRSAVDFEAYRQEFGLPRNPVKRLCGISGECCCGSFGEPKRELPAYRQVDPQFADYLDGLCARVAANGFPWDWGERPPQSWIDMRRGQTLLFDLFGTDDRTFQPMCVGCNSGRR